MDSADGERLTHADVELYGIRVNNINFHRGVYVLLALFAAAAALIYWFSCSPELTPLVAYGIFSKALAANAFLVTAFITWAWKFRVFRIKQWLVRTPDLNGTWTGRIQSTWKDAETGRKPAPIPAVLTIKQTLFTLSCVIRTEEMMSRSFAASFVIDDENQIADICYSYTSVPNQQVIERSRQHSGTARLEIDESGERTLCGEYWSDRKTTGNLEFTFWKEQQVRCFPDDFKNQHPVSAARNYER